jgi:nitrite reductase/ring-hydroxylating ferredoxin subunit
MVHRARIRQHDIAMWRQRDGTPHAWRNQCPHRGMRLSFGLIRDDRLTCAYHGWTFDKEGRCVVMPAHADGKPPPTGVPAYACTEHAAFLWVTSARDPLEPPAIRGDWQACRSVNIHASSDRVVKRLTAASKAIQPEPIPGVFRVDTPDASGPSLLCAIQPVTAGETMLHVAVEGITVDRHTTRRCSDWAKHLRWHIENEARDSAEAAHR